MCQLEGSDHGGRDSAAELALAGIKLLSDDSYNRLTLGSVPPDARNYTPRKNRVNGFFKCARTALIFLGIRKIFGGLAESVPAGESS